MTEEEFNALIKSDGKRVQKFTEHPDQFKKEFNRNRYAIKDTGVRIVRNPLDEDDHHKTYKYGYRADGSED